MSQTAEQIPPPSPCMRTAQLVILMNAHDGKVAQSRLWEHWCTASMDVGALIVFVRPSSRSRLPPTWTAGTIRNLLVAECGSEPWQVGTEENPGYGDAALARVFANLLRPFVYHAPSASARCVFASGSCAPVCLAHSWLDKMDTKSTAAAAAASVTWIDPVAHSQAARFALLTTIWAEELEHHRDAIDFTTIQSPLRATAHATWMSLPRAHAVQLLHQIHVLQPLARMNIKDKDEDEDDEQEPEQPEPEQDVFDALQRMVSDAWDRDNASADDPVFAADEWMLLWLLQSIASAEIHVQQGPVTFLRRACSDDPSPICWADLTEIYTWETTDGMEAVGVFACVTAAAASGGGGDGGGESFTRSMSLLQMLAFARSQGFLLVRKISPRVKLQVTTWIPPMATLVDKEDTSTLL